MTTKLHRGNKPPGTAPEPKITAEFGIHTRKNREQRLVMNERSNNEMKKHILRPTPHAPKAKQVMRDQRFSLYVVGVYMRKEENGECNTTRNGKRENGEK